MLKILLLILKIIGFILLGILAILLLLLLVVLFAPFRYKAKIIVNKKETDIKAGVKWIFGLLKADFFFDGKHSNFTLKVLGKALKKKSKSEKTEAEEAETGEEPESSEQTGESNKTESNEEAEEKVKETAKETASEEQAAEEQTVKDKSQKAGKGKLAAYKDLLEDESVRNALSYTLKKVGRLLKYLLPRKIKGYITFKYLFIKFRFQFKHRPGLGVNCAYSAKYLSCCCRIPGSESYIPFDLSRKKILQQSPDLL